MSTIYLSTNANKILQNYLEGQGHNLVLIQDTGLVYPEVATHPDIYMCKLGAEPEASVFHEENQLCLGYKYPENVKYNAVCMGNYFIHNLNHTAPALFDKIQQTGYKTIHVKQGYTKCNMVILNNQAAITSDEGIYKFVSKYLDVFLIKPGYVKLGNFPYGFLGGASGRVGNEIIFNGNLELHPDYKKISDFITLQNLKIKYFKEYPLEDIGSIIEWRNK
ncbi:MAG: DUF6873 family GME fold protein [Aminipila sp.]